MRKLISKDKLILLPFIGIYAWFVIKIAWVGDDAFITFRSVENFLQGYGPVFNVGERVQTYTHPLWFLLQSAANLVMSWWKNNPLGVGQVYFVNVLASISISILALLILLLGIYRSAKGAFLGITILSLSKAFLDYSTSGLENPLTHLILALFILFYLPDVPRKNWKILIVSILAALSSLNRLDTLLFYIPALSWMLWKSTERKKTFILIVCGFIPLIIWEIFSLFYYGSFFPNTAYAKINTEIALFDLIKQGAFYYLNSLRIDPITLPVIIIATILGIAHKNASVRMVAAGGVLYLLYILYIGGDFMSGRYFSSVLLVAVALLAHYEYKSIKQYALALVLVLAVGIGAQYLIPERGPKFGRGAESYRVFLDEHRVSDERLVYRQQNFLRALDKGAPKTPYTIARGNWIYYSKKPVEVELVGPLGMASHRLGPNIHVIDLNAIADPLMARMPLQNPTQWRIGHYRHIIPDGYIETLESGENVITDRNIALYYDKLSIVIKGDLWSVGRLVEIWRLNTGSYDYLLENISIDSQ